MTLKNFLKDFGRDRAAKRFGVNIRTINYWMEGDSLPRAKQMVKIHKLSNGRVSYSSIVKTVAEKK